MAADLLREQNRVLVRLAKSEAAAAGDLDAALRELAEAAAGTLQVERASVWLFDAARTRIDCVELYERSPHRHSRGLALAAADFPAYFRGLEEERAIVAHDAHRDPRTREFSAPYLTPLGIGAMLDAPIRVRGLMAGVVCHEHVGGRREWSPEEQGFAASIPDLAAFALEGVETAAERRRAERELRRAKEEAEAANRAKDRFLATLSHELRTPLTPVLALASGLEEDATLPDRVRRSLALIRRNVEKEARLIDDLLAVASAGPDRVDALTERLREGGAPAPAAALAKEAAAAAPLELLLVEDHADTAEAMADLLRALGHEVTVAGSVGAALSAAEARSGRFDLVVSDLGLPDGSGLDLMRELARLYGLKGLALSGYGMGDDVQRSREAGFSKHLTKPVDLRSLEAAILAVVEEPASAD